MGLGLLVVDLACDFLRQLVNRVGGLLALYPLRLRKLLLHSAVGAKRAVASAARDGCVHLLGDLARLIPLLRAVPGLLMFDERHLVSGAHFWRAF